jgi:hypothetical protein
MRRLVRRVRENPAGSLAGFFLVDRDGGTVLIVHRGLCAIPTPLE